MALENELRPAVSASSVSSPTSDSQVSDEKTEDLSPEDVAWIDSCLIKESEISDSNWDSMKDALLEVLSSESGLYNSSGPLGDESPAENDVQMHTPEEHVETMQFTEVEDKSEEIPRTSFNLAASEEEAESSSNNFPAENVNNLQSSGFIGNPLLPSYIKELNESQTTESGSDSLSSTDEIEPSNDEIFRVWDLNVPAEENELGLELKKFLEDNDPPSTPSVAFADSVVREDLGVVSLDDVIEAVAKISLSPDSSS